MNEAAVRACREIAEATDDAARVELRGAHRYVAAAGRAFAINLAHRIVDLRNDRLLVDAPRSRAPLLTLLQRLHLQAVDCLRSRVVAAAAGAESIHRLLQARNDRVDVVLLRLRTSVIAEDVTQQA